ncbi:hypothetical protein GM708_01205 [Vibrio cholerae]|nr:hypothetical protein [Vibrio cholerae]
MTILNGVLPGRTSASRTHGTTIRLLVVSLLLVASAACQIQASLQRWISARQGLASDDVTIEDHRFDYDFRSESWEPIGSAAQVYGTGMILLALGVLTFGHALGRVGGGSRLLGLLAMLAIAVPFALFGLDAVVAGLSGQTTPISSVTLILTLINLAGFVGLGVLTRTKITMTLPEIWVGVFLFGSSFPGYFIATFFLAPVINGDTSYDTTPWTETVLGATTAAAGIAALIAAWCSIPRNKPTP